jgi:hypothetical protein
MRMIAVVRLLPGLDSTKLIADCSGLEQRILRRAYEIIQDDLGIDDGVELHRLQVAVYG